MIKRRRKVKSGKSREQKKLGDRENKYEKIIYEMTGDEKMENEGIEKSQSRYRESIWKYSSSFHFAILFPFKTRWVTKNCGKRSEAKTL